MAIPRSLCSFGLLALMFAMSCEAEPLARQLFAGVHAAYERHIREFDWAESVKHLHEGIDELRTSSLTISAPRRFRKLTDLDCYEYAVLLWAFYFEPKCANRSLSIDLQRAEFCNSDCEPQFSANVSAALQIKACETTKPSILRIGGQCNKGSRGYCLGEDEWFYHYGMLSTLNDLNPESNVGPWCAANSCGPQIVDWQLFHGIIAPRTKNLYELILKYACTKPFDDSPTTCWADFLDVMNTANPLHEMVNSPATFCANKCKRAVFFDLMRMQQQHLKVQGRGRTQPNIVDMTMRLLDFSCMQKEDNTYCISVAMNNVESPNTWNYDGALVTKPVCEKPSTMKISSSDYAKRCPVDYPICRENGDCVIASCASSCELERNKNFIRGYMDVGDEWAKCTGDHLASEVMQCSAAEGTCAPWCKDTQYSCSANSGKCDDYLSCDPQKGEFPSHSCTCTAEIGQLMSYAGCCIAASVDFTCSLFESDDRSYDSTVDITMCDEDPAATQAKGFKMTKAMSRVESCGFVVDPRCTHGQPVKVMNFDLTFDNVDTQNVCESSAFPTENLTQSLSDSLSVATSDITVDLCAGSAGASANNTLISRVAVRESGATDLAMTRSLKKKVEALGRFSTSLEDNDVLTPVEGKLVRVVRVGSDTESSRNGVAGSTHQQIKQLSDAAQRNYRSQLQLEDTASGVVGLSLGAALLVSFVSNVN